MSALPGPHADFSSDSPTGRHAENSAASRPAFTRTASSVRRTSAPRIRNLKSSHSFVRCCSLVLNTGEAPAPARRIRVSILILKSPSLRPLKDVRGRYRPSLCPRSCAVDIRRQIFDAAAPARMATLGSGGFKLPIRRDRIRWPDSDNEIRERGATILVP